LNNAGYAADDRKVAGCVVWTVRVNPVLGQADDVILFCRTCCQSRTCSTWQILTLSRCCSIIHHCISSWCINVSLQATRYTVLTT